MLPKRRTFDLSTDVQQAGHNQSEINKNPMNSGVGKSCPSSNVWSSYTSKSAKINLNKQILDARCSGAKTEEDWPSLLSSVDGSQRNSQSTNSINRTNTSLTRNDNCGLKQVDQVANQQILSDRGEVKHCDQPKPKPPLRLKSYQERVNDYERARQRIFGLPQSEIVQTERQD